MTDDAWEILRRRAILTAMETGRPVFADSDGVLRYADGAQEAVVAAPLAVTTPRSLSWWRRLWRWLRGGS